MSIPSANSHSELCGTDTHYLRWFGCNWDFSLQFFKIGFEAPNHPHLVTCSVLHLCHEKFVYNLKDGTIAPLAADGLEGKFQAPDGGLMDATWLFLLNELL